MKKFYPVFASVLLTICINGQSSGKSDTEVEARAGSAGVTTGNIQIEIPKKDTGIEIPPEKARPVTIPKINPAGIVIDGKPEEEMWKTASVFKDFYQTSPGDNTAPSKPTEVLMMYDEKNLYVAFKCWDEKDKVRASVAKRDNVYGEDNVRMWIDTYNDQRRAYVLGFNPFGIQQDGIFTEGNGADFSVDIVMESKGVIEDWGWSVEVKIPFKSLRYSAGK
ncbi:MAG: carbohydrate binding family 9 domain-containing protein, partial [Acidobacteriota bacterium]